MINPPTRPYLPEELEELKLEQQAENKAAPLFVFKNNVLEVPAVSETTPESLPTPETSKSVTRPKYLPLLIIGLIGISVGIYVYYKRQKAKEKRNATPDSAQ